MTINTLQFPAQPSATARFARYAGNVATRVVDLFQAYKHRRTLAELVSLDERMLRDIGLTRGDLRDAVAEPLWRDPTNILVMRARERRAFNQHAIQGPSIAPSIDECGSRQFPARSRYY